MPRLFIGFEWPVDLGGYAYTPPAANRPSRGVTLLTGGDEPTPGPDTIAPRGGRVEVRRPLEASPILFVEFANLPLQPQACVHFAAAYGLLRSRSETTDGEWLEFFWYEEIRRMKQALEYRQNGYTTLLRLDYFDRALANLNARLIPGPDGGRPVLEVVPNSLLSALWLQFAQFIAEDRDLLTCEFCGKWFALGPGARRRVARFCTDQHRDAFHNREKARRAKR